MTDLPIDVIPNSSPLRFRWRQTVHTVVGSHDVTLEGEMPASCEDAVASIIALAKQQARQLAERQHDIDNLKRVVLDVQRINQGFADRIAAQSELLSKRAEAAPPAQVCDSFKGKRGGK